MPPLSERVDLATVDPSSTPGWGGGGRDPGGRDPGGKDPSGRTSSGKDVGRADLAALGPDLADLQERLYADGRSGGTRRVVLVLQAMDSGGKDGAVKHVVGLVNPAGVRISSFGPPTEQERAHPYLWRVEQALPTAGMLGVFNRSHYEDVLVVRVHDLVPREQWQKRYAEINAWEAQLAATGTVFVKVFLHISYDEQRRRLLTRLDDPTKLWKVSAADLAERECWPAYQQAYEAVLERCSTVVAPWYLVPADRKWYRDWALAHLLLETLQALNLQWPARPDLDLAALRTGLLAGPASAGAAGGQHRGRG